MKQQERKTYFDQSTTPLELQESLETLRIGRLNGWGTATRARIFYGDRETGQDWHEEFGTIGYIGRSTGYQPIPLLIHNSRCLGGPAILVANIVKLVAIRKQEILWIHPKYHCDWFFAVEEVAPDDPTYTAVVYQQPKDSPARLATVYARCKTLEEARRLADFMAGKRNSK